MDNISVCVSFIAAILGIAYPILLEVISRLDEKYSSQIIVDLFSKERENKFFTFSLRVSLVSLLVWMLKLPPHIKIDGLNILIGKSSEYILIISTILLIVSFFYFVKKVLVYYTPTKYLPYIIERHLLLHTNKIIEKHNKKSEDNEFEFFRAIADVLYFSIKNQNEKISQTVSDFMYGAFKKVRDNIQNKEVVYPSTYYDLVYKTIEDLAFQKNKRLTFLEHRTAGSVWLLGEFGNTKVSEETYVWIWRNILLAIKYEREDYIIYHWETAYQYIRQSLDYIYPNYSNETFEITNQGEIDIRLSDRKRFLEFHYALGGLLLYKKHYNCLQRAFSYTQSIPPQYELLPDTMDEVFGLYFNFRDPYEMKHPWISSRYGFPDLGGLNSDGIIKQWICKYIALLFIRQYSIVPHLITMKPLNYPRIPTTQGEKRQWIDNLDYFKKLVEEVLNNKELLITTGLDFVADEWCEKYNQPKPIEFIEKVKQNVIDSFEGTEIEQPVSPTKVQRFRNTTASILKPIFEEYQIIDNEFELNGDLNKWYVNGRSNIIDKSGFAENQDAEHSNFDSFLPESFSNKYKDAISAIFVLASSASYLLNSQDIVPGISRLGIVSNDYAIVSFGINIQELIKNANNDSLKDFKIINFNHRNYHLVGDSLFVLKLKDLPKLNYKEPKSEEIEKYSLVKTIDEYNLYTTVVDLNLSPDLREEFAENSNGKDLRKSIYMAISMSLEVQWKKSIHCIQIKQASAYRERGIINNLSDIKAIVEKPSR
ncbi:hypothetical protein [Niabella soli]|uniref:Uncharacterized protein n=1 Tax=Niabella soli DSM 19437 TaxID=929713 RepID=W0F8J3_9BACT|nr:hypothetical protein [Niabella soli]AHF17666.1 hypothetical protein NIASO_11935 [Niabella soli DSM 19437]